MTTSNDELVWERLDTLRARVRDALANAERAAEQAQAEAARADTAQAEAQAEAPAGAALRAAVRELVEITRAELSIEDGEVIPILAHADSWGPIRAFYLRADLAEERAALTAIDEDAACKPLDEVADEVLWIVESLRRSLRAGDKVIALHRQQAR
jgi:hypothetical protein